MATDYGKTLSYKGGDFSPDLRFATGIQVLTDALRRRFETQEGSYPADRGYGYDLSQLLLENIPDASSIRDRIELECKKDERVETADVTVDWNPEMRELKAYVSGTSELGPFDFTVSVDEVSFEFLEAKTGVNLGLA